MAPVPWLDPLVAEFGESKMSYGAMGRNNNTQVSDDTGACTVLLETPMFLRIPQRIGETTLTKVALVGCCRHLDHRNPSSEAAQLPLIWDRPG